jgi:hypothetical protein
MEDIYFRKIVESVGNYVPSITVHCESRYGIRRQMFRLRQVQFRYLASAICELFKRITVYKKHGKHTLGY